MHLLVRQLGLTDYGAVLAAMQKFTNERTPSTNDELWITQHNPVFTLGQAGKSEHLLLPGDIPVVQSDRGGQVTYHGPGQLIIYLLINIKRQKLFVRDLVCGIEKSIIQVLADLGIPAENRSDAPGVYVAGAKIAALGLRIRKMCSYHGLSFNISMDLEPFERINPCGIRGLSVTQLKDLGGPDDLSRVALLVVDQLVQQLGYSGCRSVRAD